MERNIGIQRKIKNKKKMERLKGEEIER